MTDTSSVIKVLALDHFYDQDLRALEASPQLHVRRIGYQRLRRPALRILGDEVGTGLVAYNRPELEPARRRYATWLAGEVRRLFLEDSFDVVVLPSDTFFYVRSLPEAAHALGIPVVVVQKETTISPDTMELHSQEVRAQAAFVADLMLVCSERHREFWLRVGADPEKIVVTGQPRFDVYMQQPPRPRHTPPVTLFLSYVLDAYVPGVGHGMGLSTWEPLRSATEQELLRAAAAGSCRVVVKFHPQQDAKAEAARLRKLAGPLFGHSVSVAAPDADTRALIIDSDLVVGFQTTAMYEGVLAHKPVVYAAWGDAYEQYRDSLVPFHTAPPGCVHHAHDPGELARWLMAPPPAPGSDCRGWCEEALGPVDGQATQRVVNLLAKIVGEYAPTSERVDLERHRRRFARRLLLRSGVSELVWTLAHAPAAIAGEQARVTARRRSASEQRRLALRSLRHPPKL